MKSNEEFLKGVYDRAEILSNEKKAYNKKPNKYLRYSSIAALFIIIPILLIQGNLNKEAPIDINEPRVMSFGNIDQSFKEADYILIGTIEDKVFNDNKFDASVSISEVLYGDVYREIIEISGPDFISDSIIIDQQYIFMLKEQDNKFYLYNDLEGLLVNDNSDSYIDVFGNKYTIEDVLNNIDGRR